MNGFYDYKERIDDDFNIFDNEDNGEMMEEPIFYSKQEIEFNYAMDEEVNNYLGWFFIILFLILIRNLDKLESAFM